MDLWIYVLFFKTFTMLFASFSDLRICDGLSGLYMIDVECKSARASKAFVFFACSALFSVHFKIPELSDAKFLIPPVVLASLFSVCSPR